MNQVDPWSAQAEELRACRVCFATDAKLLDLHTDNLVDTFAEFTGFPISTTDALPQHICSLCLALLRKSAAFRAKCRKTQDVLRSQLRIHPLTMEYLRSHNSHFKLPFSLSNMSTLSYPEDEEPGSLNNSNVKKEIVIDYELDESKSDYFYDVVIDGDKGKDNSNYKIFLESNDVKLEDASFASNRRNDCLNKENAKVRDYVIQCSQDSKDKNRKMFYDYILNKYINKTEIVYKNDFNTDLLDSEDEYFVQTEDNSIFVYNKDSSNNDFITNTDPNKSIFYDFIKDKYFNKRKPEKKKKVVSVTRLRMRKIKENKKFKSSDELANFAKKYNFDIILLSKEQQYQEIQLRKESPKYQKARYKCESCGRGFTAETAFNNHLIIHDPSNGKHACEVCGIWFPTLRQLNKHLLNHKMKYSCKLCPRHFRNSSEAKKHYQFHAGVKFECEHCGKIFSKYGSRVNHIRIHHGSTVCDICYDSFQGSHGLVAHKTKAHKEVFLCSACDACFDNLDALQRHAVTAIDGCGLHIKPCTKCGDSFETDQELSDHIAFKHSKLKVERKIQSKRCPNARKRKRKCVCKNLSNNDPNIKCPMNVVRPRSEGGCSTDTKGQNKTSKGKCLCKGQIGGKCIDETEGDCTCGANECKLGEGCACKTKRKKKIRKFMCEMCAVASFSSEAHLRYHQRIHTGEMPFQCDECSRRFRLKESLQKHARIHTGDRPYKCAHCPKTFRSYAARYRHRLVHTKERRHRCSYCDKMFLTSTCVNTHVRTVHMKIPQPPRVRNRRKNVQ